MCSANFALSHAGIVAREYKLPAVVGTKNATPSCEMEAGFGTVSGD
ncbi:PEP-utilizing enzyme [Paenibacillus thermotolerans]